MRRAPGIGGIALLVASAGGCLPTGPAGAPTPSARETADLVPPGYGSLRQDQIAMNLVVGPLRVQVTPLDPGLIRLTAPDTWERLSALRARAGAESARGEWFLVSVQTEAPGGAEFDPMDVEILAQGSVHRAEDVVGLTSRWGSGRLRQRTTEQALYRFPDTVDPWRDIELQVGDVRYTAWPDRLPTFEAERARVRARAGGFTRPGRTS